MPNVGERWKFPTAQVDFTITRIEGDMVYYVMNWPNESHEACSKNYYVIDGNSDWHIESIDFDAEGNSSIESFLNGTVVRSDA